MIAKVTQGASGMALIRYLMGPGKANEHTDQRVLTSGIVMGVEEGKALSAQEIADLGAALDASNDTYRSNPAGGHIWHLSLSLPPGDRQLSDEDWAEMAHRAIEAIGFEGEGVTPAAWVAVGHGTSANGNQHLHIAASLVRVDGARVDIWQSKRTISRVCAELEHTYGLSVVEGREGKGMPGLSRAELERAALERLAESPRITLTRMVREASVASRDEAEFIRRLRGSGALVRPRFATGGKEAVVGYSVALRTENGDTPIWFGGGKLAKDLTLPHLRRFWEVSPKEEKAAVAEWSATRSLVRGREAVLGGPDDWRRALGGMERTVERLRAVPTSDLAAWRGVAREAAGVFAAWSRRAEGDNPGPLAACANTLARSAQRRADEPVPNRDAARDLRGIAAIVAQSEINSHSPIVWAALIDQLGHTLRAIGAAHAARGEAEMAKVLVDNLSGELEVLLDRFETSSPQELSPGERIAQGGGSPAWLKIPDHQTERHHRRESNHERGFGR
jgi:hypothetical protein